MSQNVTLNGNPFVIPDLAEINWGQNVTDYLVAIPAGVLQKTGGTFTLSAELDFGAAFGIKSLYYKSRTANVASAGNIRLANTDSIAFRDAGNTADLLLAVNGSNQLTFNGIVLESDTLNSGQMFVGNASNESTARTISGAWTMSNVGVATISSDYITNVMINSAAAIALTKLAALTVNRLVYSNGSGVITPMNWSTDGSTVTTGAENELRFQDNTGGDYVGIKAPASVTTHTYLLPTAAGSAGQVLSWQTGGQLQWISAVGGTINAGTTGRFGYYTASQTISDQAILTYASSKIGIGTASPSNILHVKNTADFIKMEQTSSLGDIPLEFENSTDAQNWQLRYRGSDKAMTLYDLTSANYRFLFTKSGDMGIGIDPPAARLDIVGSSSDTPGTNQVLRFNNSFGWRIDASTGQYLNLDTFNSGWNAIPAITVHRVGPVVGIGTTTPGAVLHVSTANQEVFRLQRTTTSASNYRFNVTTDLTGDNADLQIQPDTSGTGLSFRARNAGGTSTFGIGVNRVGRVGIGALDPQTNCHIKSPDTGSDQNVLIIDRGTNGLAVDDIVGLHFGMHGDSTENRKLARIAAQLKNSTGSPNGDLLFYTATNSVLSEKMRINNTGQVGVGTSSPGGPFQVYLSQGVADTPGGSIILNRYEIGGSWRGAALFNYYSSGLTCDALGISVSGTTTPLSLANMKMMISEIGRVGIGLTTPLYKLHVYEASSQADFYVQDGAGAGVRIIAGASAGYVQTQTNHPLIFSTNNSSPWLTIATDGKIGTNGLTSPDTLLHLYGGSSVPKIKFQDTANHTWTMGSSATNSFFLDDNTAVATRLFITGGGYVGINLNVPTTPLHLSGSSLGTDKALMTFSDVTEMGIALHHEQGGWLIGGSAAGASGEHGFMSLSAGDGRGMVLGNRNFINMTVGGSTQASTSYTSKDNTNRYFVLSPDPFGDSKWPCVLSNFTIGGNTYTIRGYRPANGHLLVYEDISGESASGTLSNIYYTQSAVRIDTTSVRIYPAGAQKFAVDNTSTAGQTSIQIYDVDNGGVERVTVGAADSGGTGYKVLRIPN